jgi:hypothetical protein
MTVGQQETIIYQRKLVHSTRSNFLSPTHGIGYGLGETGIVLDRVLNTGIENTPRRVVGEVKGIGVEESAGHLTLELRDGRRLKIGVADIIRRTKR